MEGFFTELINVSKKFGDSFVLKGINYSFPDDGLVLIEGKSGSGKSTLLNLLATLESPSSGLIHHFGECISKYGKSKASKFRNEQCGIVFQRFNLIEGISVLDNVSMPMRIGGKKKKEADIEARGLLNKFHIGHLADREVSALSGGEKQRVAILRSISNDPSILLCDEPTGALDVGNSSAVMELLKQLSKDRLVIVVSHDIELSEKYADVILILDNGHLNVKKEKMTNRKKINQCKKKKTNKSDWIRPILNKNIKLDKKKNIFGFISVFFAYCSLLLAFSFIYGSFASIEKEKKTVMTYDTFSISEKKIYDIPSSPLKLSRVERPEFSKAKEIVGDGAIIRNDYSYFVPQVNAFKMDGIDFDPCEFIPLDNFSRSSIKERGYPKEENFCVVNESFFKKYKPEIGSIINFYNETSVNIEGKNHDVSIEMKLEVFGYAHEFPFLSTPKVYYQYSFLEKLMDEHILNETEEEPSIKSLVDEAPPSSPWTSYSYMIFSLSNDKTEYIRNKISSQNGQGLVISSSSYEAETSFSKLVASIAASIAPFILIELIGSSFIIGAVSYSSYLERRKEGAILLALGAKETDISSIYIIESLVVSISGAFISLIASIGLTYLLNPFLQSITGFPSVLHLPLLGIGPYKFIIEIALVALSFVSSFIGSALPLLFKKRGDVAKGLQEE